MAAASRGTQAATAPCRIYVHDPGSRFNEEPLRIAGERWSQADHSWHVAYHLHQALLSYRWRTINPARADVIFVAHYFLHSNPQSDPLHFGSPLLAWDAALAAGPSALFGNDSRLLQRWAQRPSDFVVAPLLIACKSAPRWLRAARWILLDQFFGNACRYQPHDVIAPYVPSDKWPADPPLGLQRRHHLILYAGRLGKAYLDPPRTLLRYRVWAALRRHPSVTLWATDVMTAVAPYLALPVRHRPSNRRPCERELALGPLAPCCSSPAHDL